jgi:hypothetical protein
MRTESMRRILVRSAELICAVGISVLLARTTLRSTPSEEGPLRACLAHWAGAPHPERLRVIGVDFGALNGRRALVSLKNNCNSVTCEAIQRDGRWHALTLSTTDMECPGAEDPRSDL